MLESMLDMGKWMYKIKIFIKNHWILCLIIFFIELPLLLNIGLYITDIIYNKYGWTLTASELGNKEWLDFWGTYLSVVIAFVGICLAWKSSDEERKMGKNEKLAQEYDENLKEEKYVLIGVCQSFNIDIIYKTIIELNNMDTKDCRRVLQNARECVLDTQVKFELLTDIADDFQKCEKCNFNPCYDRENMIAIRDLYYRLENIYLKILQDCGAYIDKIEKQQIIEKMIQDDEKIISLQQQHSRYDFEVLKEEKISDEEIKELATSIIEGINLISQEMKPQLINYCKSYIDWKKRHKNELLQEGRIHYIKYPERSEKTDLEN